MGRLQQLESRRVDRMVAKAALTNEVYERIEASESVKYAIGAMQPIDPTYTDNTYAEGDRVKNQLTKRMAVTCDYRYQGSTTNDTHIKAHSDIDLLVITQRFVWIQPPQPNPYPYTGDAKADLRLIRSEAIESVEAAFHEATVEKDNPKAIRLEGGSLSRRVDIVPASWLNTNEYVANKDETYRGIEIFDAGTGDFIGNKPFLFNHRVDERDARTGGGMRKAARLMKSLNYDYSKTKMSSFNITSIAYNMPDDMVSFAAPDELSILNGCCDYCKSLEDNGTLRALLRVPDDTRGVFEGKAGASMEQLRSLNAELQALRADVLRDTRRTLSEAKIPYQIAPRVVFKTGRLPAMN